MANSPSESRRLREDPAAWRKWGPYLSERAWGTVREDYSEHGDAWDWFPHDHARSRVYRWNEDGLGGICDDQQRLCFAFAFWNGRDPILKERIFGLTGPEGNHGEDAKEYWWYLDSTPSHSWMRWRYLYPQAEFPYADLVAENRRRGAGDPEYELLDTGIFDGDRYWEITADYAKAAPDDLCIRVTVRNPAPDEQTIDLLPTLWFRNTWSWGLDDRRPSLSVAGGALVAQHHSLGRFVLAGDGHPGLLMCDNETNRARLFGAENVTRYPKDGIADHVVHGAGTVNPDGTGTKGALQRRRHLHAGQVGVPVVRGLGPGVPLRGPRPRRPARPRLGGTARVRGRRDGGLRVSRARLPQAAPQLHVVGQPQGRRREQHLRGRVPRARQHRSHRPVHAAARGRSARAVRRHRLDGHVLPQPARDRPGPGRARPGV